MHVVSALPWVLAALQFPLHPSFDDDREYSMADIEFAQYDPTEDYTDSEGSGDGEMTFPHPFGKQKDQLPWGENIKMERAKPVSFKA